MGFAALAPILGGLIGAGGQIAGGQMASATGGDPRVSRYNPNLDAAMQASLYDSLNGIGFGDISNAPGPYQQLINNISSQTMPDKTRNQIIAAMENIRNNPSLLDDPYGTQFTRDEVFQANKTGAPPGRFVTRGPEGGQTNWGKKGAGIGGASGGPVGALVGYLAGKFGDSPDQQPTGLPIARIGKVVKQLRGLGMNLEDFRGLLTREAEHKARLKRLQDAGLGKWNENTILSRARANATSNELIGGAADFARTGQPGEGIGRSIFDRDEEQMRQIQDRLGVLANFGGMNPATMFEQMQNTKLNQQVRLIEQQLGMSGALQAALNPGLAAASGAASLSQNSNLNAANIAASQAQAANQLRSQQAMNRGSALGNGIAGGLGSLGGSFSDYGIMSQMRQENALNRGSGWTSGFNTGGNTGTSGQELG